MLLDSSAILALVDADDVNHDNALEVAGQIAAERRPVFVTNHLRAEAHALLLTRLGRGAAREWLLRSGVDVIYVTRAEEETAIELLSDREDKDWSLCDAISFVVVTQRRVGGAFSYDAHFHQFGRVRVWGTRADH